MLQVYGMTRYFLNFVIASMLSFWLIGGLISCSANEEKKPAVEKKPKPPAVVVMTDEITYVPYEVVVHVGDTVEWENGSLLVHTVTADPELVARNENVALPDGAKPFNSGDMEPGGVFRHEFAVPGAYRYFCIPHEGAGMVGVVVVKP